MKMMTTVLAILLLTLFSGWWNDGLAQSELVVEWQDPETGLININALLDAIEEDQANDPPDDRVYVLQAGGFYWNTDRIDATDYDVRIVGEEPSEDQLPPVLQMVHDEDGEWDEKFIVANRDLELRNFWLVGRTDQGNEGWGMVDFTGADAEIIIDNLTVEYNFSAFFHALDSGQDISITNSHFRNMIDHDQYWAGRILRTEAETDRIFVENNTFFNIGHTVVQATEPEGELWFNHNTVVNTGRGVIDGDQWQNAYVTNNLFINGFWHGEVEEDYSSARQQEEDNQFGSWFSIDYLDPALGFDADRIIALHNNVTWVNPELDEYYTEYQDPNDPGQHLGGPSDYTGVGSEVRAAPFLNIRARDIVEENEQISWENHLDLWMDGEDLGLQFYEDGHFDELSQNMIDWVDIQRRETFEEPPDFYWEVEGRPTSGDELLESVEQVYPIADMAENFSYTHDGALTNATGDYPAGDLNWYPDEKESWEAERDELEEIIRGDFEIEPFELRVEYEAEDGELFGDAEIHEFDGFASFFLESGEMVWEFDMDEGGEYGLNVHHNMGDQAERGQHIIVNDVALLNNEDFGEYYWGDDTPQEEWLVEEIRNDDLYDGQIMLEEGSNEVRIEASWGFQYFSGIDIVDADGEIIREYGTFDASTRGGNLLCEDEQDGEEVDFCPSGGAWVDLGGGGGINWDFEALGSGDYRIQVLYQLENGSAQADLEVDGTTVETLEFDEDSGEQEAAFTEVNLADGEQVISLNSASGGVNIDAIQFFTTDATWTSIGDDPVADQPQGFELKQNYPNPFNPATNIEFELPRATDITLTVYDAIGRRVTTLAEGQYRAGQHTVQFDASNLASGMYIYRLEAGDFSQTRQMMFIK